MDCNWKREQEERGDIDGIPVVEQYKYLGCVLERDLSMRKYLQFVEEKVARVSKKLWKVRKLRKLRVNINLFKMLVMPRVRMAAINLKACYATQKKEFIQMVKREFKRWCWLPKNTENKAVRILLGDLEGLFEGVVQEADVMLRARFGLDEIVRKDFEADGTDWVAEQTYEWMVMMKGKCGICSENKRMSERHVMEEHGIAAGVEHWEKLWRRDRCRPSIEKLVNEAIERVRGWVEEW